MKTYMVEEFGGEDAAQELAEYLEAFQGVYHLETAMYRPDGTLIAILWTEEAGE